MVATGPGWLCLGAVHFWFAAPAAPIRPNGRFGFTGLMNPLASFDFFLRVGRDLWLAVLSRDGLEARPQCARRAVGRRLASGLVVLGAYLRRLLVLMALALEPGLQVAQRPMRRPHGRTSAPRPRFIVWKQDYGPRADFIGCAPIAHKGAHKGAQNVGQNVGLHAGLENHLPSGATSFGPQPIRLAQLYQKLDLIAGILADPLPRARRLALHLARNRPGVLMPPDGPARIAGRWGADVSASYDMIALGILTDSRTRPPPLPPPRRQWPSLTRL
jgi:hypothetical protein